MKTKLITSEEDSITGYRNIHYEDFQEIDHNSCFELYVGHEVLKMIPNKAFSDFVQICRSKIRMDGMLIIAGRDIMKISLSYIHKSIDERILSDLLYGSNGFYNCRIAEEEIKKNGLKIHSMSIIDENFIVRGIRE